MQYGDCASRRAWRPPAIDLIPEDEATMQRRRWRGRLSPAEQDEVRGAGARAKRCGQSPAPWIAARWCTGCWRRRMASRRWPAAGVRGCSPWQTARRSHAPCRAGRACAIHVCRDRAARRADPAVRRKNVDFGAAGAVNPERHERGRAGPPQVQVQARYWRGGPRLHGRLCPCGEHLPGQAHYGGSLNSNSTTFHHIACNLGGDGKISVLDVCSDIVMPLGG